MSKLKILKVPNPILRQSCPRHEGSYQQILNDLLDTMKDIGYGLAAPQVGVLTRLAVVRTSSSKEPIVLVNPEIINRLGRSSAQEACLSLPGISLDILRWETIFVRSDAWMGSRRFHGITARAIQHECDHLEGICIDERIARELS